MKRKYSMILIVASAALCVTYGFSTQHNKTNVITHSTNAKGFAVVELFTSEGCSSCPPADAAVAELLSKKIENVYILAYHVDYWNKLGWKDQFSKAEYSQRQSEYASALNLSSVYTPQVIVNGTTEFVGSDEDKLSSTVENDLSQEIKQNLAIGPVKTGNTVTINYDTGSNDDVLLNLALVQPSATTDVKRGENGGRVLKHVNIVRLLKTIDAKGKGTATIDIPAELSNNTLQLIAYTQQKESLRILGADEKPL